MGEAVRCGDLRTRVLFPGILIQAVDGEEACGTCGTRGAKANHPCPRCLVPKQSLSQLSQKFQLRTQEGMIRIYKQVRSAPTNAAQDKLLRDTGLHFVKVCSLFFSLVMLKLTPDEYIECILENREFRSICCIFV